MRGKLRPRVAPKQKDWHDVILTVCRTGLSAEEVTAMTARQRTLAKELATQSYEGEECLTRQARTEAVRLKLKQEKEKCQKRH
jgi:hypothetical protein